MICCWFPLHSSACLISWWVVQVECNWGVLLEQCWEVESDAVGTGTGEVSQPKFHLPRWHPHIISINKPKPFGSCLFLQPRTVNRRPVLNLHLLLYSYCTGLFKSVFMLHMINIICPTRDHLENTTLTSKQSPSLRVRDMHGVGPGVCGKIFPEYLCTKTIAMWLVFDVM